MSEWKMASVDGAGGQNEVRIDFSNDDQSGTVSGTLWFKNEPFTVHGQWAAAGSVDGRFGSSVAFWGVDSRGIDYIAAAGTIELDGTGAPTSIALNLTRIEDSNSQVYGWAGTLKPSA